MKKWFSLVLALLVLVLSLGIAGAETTAVSKLDALSNQELISLLSEVQQEIVNRSISKTATLIAGTYVGGRDIPVGNYELQMNGTKDDGGIVSLAAATDDKDAFPSVLYEFVLGTDQACFHIHIGEGDILDLPFRCKLTIAPRIFFE